jgi:hypothetical protein
MVSTPPESAMRTVVGMGTGSTCLFKEKKMDHKLAEQILVAL